MTKASDDGAEPPTTQHHRLDNSLSRVAALRR